MYKNINQKIKKVVPDIYHTNEKKEFEFKEFQKFKFLENNKKQKPIFFI